MGRKAYHSRVLIVLTALVVSGAAQFVASAGAGSASGAPAWCPDAREDGCWLTPFDGEVPAVNMALLNDGRVMYYSGVEADESDTNPTHLTFIWGTKLKWGETRIVDITGYNPDGTVDAAVTTPQPTQGAGYGDLFCSGFTVAPDGRVLAAGATEWYTLDDGAPEGSFSPLKGLNVTRFLDPAIDRWVLAEPMDLGRWYPSVITLADGDVLAASGIQTLVQPQTHNAVMERFDGEEWHRIEPTMRYADGVEVGMFGSIEGAEVAGMDFAPDETQLAVANLPMYPRLFVVPGGPLEGEVFYSTVGTLWGTFGERPEEMIWSLQQSLDVDSGTWTVLGPSVYGVRQHANSVPLLLDPARDYAPEILTFGGTLERSILAVPFAEMADLATNPPTNRAVDDLTHPRWHANGVLLPTGEVLAVGGGLYDNVMLHGAPNVPVNVAELFDPATGTWREVGEMNVDRMYHSTAVLLPDGRILAGGHVPLPAFSKLQRDTVNPQVVEERLEVFEPPYLFIQDSRPAITAAPATAGFGTTVQVEVTGLEHDVHSVVLMRPGATTHAYDADQRGVLLDAEVVARGPGGAATLSVTLPPSGNVAPPGHYMLFVNEAVPGEGTFPSEARFVQIG